VTTFAGPPAETEPGIGALTLGGLLVETAARHREREAVVFRAPGRAVLRWSYDELEAEVRRLARALVAAGVEPGTRVAVLLGNRPEWVAAAYATALVGGVIVAVNTFLAPPELEYVLRHSDAALLLTEDRLVGRAYVEELADRCPELRDAAPGSLSSATFPSLRRVVALGLEDPAGAVEPWADFAAGGEGADDAVVDERAAAVTPDDAALVIYTSGSTATPKGILHAHRGPARQSWRFARHLCLDPTARVWSAFPLFWSAGFAMVMGGTLAAGACLVLEEHFDPARVLRLLEAERVTSPHAWAHQLAALEDHPDWARRDLSAIRQCESFSSFGRHPTVHVTDAWSSRAAYGLSETCTIISALPADTPSARRDASQGAILPGNEVRVLDVSTGEPLPAGETGELAVRGPTLMEHYVKDDPGSCFDEDGFFHTGDVGFVDDDECLHWTGRTSDMIKTGGANVSPVEVELALLRHPALAAALVVGVPDPLLGERVVVCAVPHDDADVTESDVRAFLRGRLASYKIPRRVLFFDEDELSMTANAKIRTSALRELAAARLGLGTEG
jgi:acyl-CoA synthetase (AMP-forming)/AMP-acid ligase II